MTSITVEATKPLGVKPRDAERSKNFFALGLICWMYTRPTEPLFDWIKTRFGNRPAGARSQHRRVQGRRELRRDGRAVRPPVRGEARAAAAGHVPQHHRQRRAVVRPRRRRAVKAKLPLFYASYPITPASDILHELSKLKHFGVKTLQAEDEIARGGRRGRRRVRRQPRGHRHERARCRPQVGGDRPRAQPRAADGHRRRAARRSVDRPADQDRAGRPAARDVRPARRGAAADRRGEVAGRLLRRRVRSRAHRGEVPDAGDPAHRRLPRQRRRAVEAPRRRRAARHLDAVRDRAEPRRRVLAVPPRPRDARRGRGRSRARPASCTASAASRRRTAPATSATSPRTTRRWCASAPPRSPASRTTSPASTSTTSPAPSSSLCSWGGTWGVATAAVRRDPRARPADRARAPARTSTRSRPTSARSSRGYDTVLVPELNLGQLSRLLRAEYLVDAQSFTKVQGSPFKAAEVEDEDPGVDECVSDNGTRERQRRRRRSKLARKDFQSDQEVRWCPGCGDYGILAAIQFMLPETGIKPEDLVFVSGIGCAARLPYYMNTYGIHGIHGRAPAIATGVALGPSRPARVGDRRRRRHVVDRWQPPDPRAAPQREPQDPDVQQPDLRAHEGAVLTDERARQGHEVDAVRVARPSVQPDLGRARRRGDVRRPHPRHGPQAHDRDVQRVPTSTRARRSSRSTRTATSSTTARSTRSSTRTRARTCSST